MASSVLFAATPDWRDRMSLSCTPICLSLPWASATWVEASSEDDEGLVPLKMPDGRRVKVRIERA